MTNLNQIAKELEQKTEQWDKKGILGALKKVPDFYLSLIDHTNLQFLRDECSKIEAKVKNWKWLSLTDKLFDEETLAKWAEGKPVPKHRTIVDDIYAFAELLRSFAKNGDKTDDDAYISFTDAVRFSSGILNHKILNKAIEKDTVRWRKPSKQRKTVHIQDILRLIKEQSNTEEAKEQAAKMFGEYTAIRQKKIHDKLDLS